MRTRKKRRRFGKTAIIYLGIVISLNLVGIGYGHWSSTISVQNTMVTGDVKAAFSRNLSTVGFENVMYGEIDEHNMNIAMNIGIASPSVGYFQIVNNGTLPIAVNYQSFQPIRGVVIAGVPVNIKIDFDIPGAKHFNRGLGNGYIEPGSMVYGKIIVEVPKELGNNPIGFMNNGIGDNNLMGMGLEALDFKSIILAKNGDGNIITKSTNIPIDIPIGCGIWEEVLTLNTNLNVSRLVSLQLPEINNGSPSLTYYGDENGGSTFLFNQNPDYTYLPDGNAGYGVDQGGSLDISGDGNSNYSYIADENESKKVFGSEETNYNSPSVGQNGSNSNFIYQISNGGN